MVLVFICFTSTQNHLFSTGKQYVLLESVFGIIIVFVEPRMEKLSPVIPGAKQYENNSYYTGINRSHLPHNFSRD